jgi:capsular exopolysaccharide synthesis family protein
MRKPRLHKIFKLQNKTGLSTFLSGNTEIDDVQMMKTPIKNLSILPSGPIPPNPAELLSSDRLEQLINRLSQRYDFILIDSPPILGMTDAAITSTRTNGVILVVRAGETPKEATQQAKKILESVNSKVLGVVLNAMSEPHIKYGYYSYYHSYYQNYGADAKK